jgi:hypothetical protein
MDATQDRAVEARVWTGPYLSSTSPASFRWRFAPFAEQYQHKFLLKNDSRTLAL